jgi:hypothetical protein
MKQVLLAATSLAFVSADSIYSPLKSEVSIYNQVNFPKQVTNNREKGISIVQFYKGSGNSISSSNFRI